MAVETNAKPVRRIFKGIEKVYENTGTEWFPIDASWVTKNKFKAFSGIYHIDEANHILQFYYQEFALSDSSNGGVHVTIDFSKVINGITAVNASLHSFDMDAQPFAISGNSVQSTGSVGISTAQSPSVSVIGNGGTIPYLTYTELAK